MTQALVISGISYEPMFGFAFLLGLVILVMFSAERFNEPYPGNEHLSQLLPSEMSPDAAYNKAFLVYFGVLLLVYASASLTLPTALQVWSLVFGQGTMDVLSRPAEGSAAALHAARADPAVPLGVALIMVGLLPNARGFDRIEAPLRRWSHRMIGVPAGLTSMKDAIAGQRLRADLLTEGERAARTATLRLLLGRQIDRAPAWARPEILRRLDLPPHPQAELAAQDRPLDDDRVQELDTIMDRFTAMRSVAMKAQRVRVLAGRLIEAGQAPFLAGRPGETFAGLKRDILRSHAEVKAEASRIGDDARNLIELIGTLEAARRSLPAERAAGPGAVGAIAPGLGGADLARVQSFLDELLERRLADFQALEPRFDALLDKLHLFLAAVVVVTRTAEERQAALDHFALSQDTHVQRPPLDEVLLAMGVTTIALFLFNYAYQALVVDHSGPGQSPPVVNALRTVVVAMIVHGAAVLVAFAWRQRRLGRGRWRMSGEAGVTIPVKQYLRLGLLIFVPNYLVLLGWIIVLYTSATGRLAVVTEAMVLSSAVLALATVLTGLFVASNLDRARSGPVDRKTLLRRAVAHGGATALMVVLASEIEWAGVPDLPPAYDLGISGFLIGAVMSATVLYVVSLQHRGAGVSPDGGDLPARGSLKPA